MIKLEKHASVAALLLMTCAAVAQDHNRPHDAELDADTLAERRQQILEMTRETVTDLKTTDAAAAELLDEAYGYAVFDTTKGGFIVTGAGGTGAAVRKNGRDPVFMHMGAGGVGLGAGLENYKLVVVLQDERTYDRFVDGEWSAGASAQAAAGGDGAAAVGRFVNGVAVYHLTDKGVIAQIDITGVKFWPSDRLNPGVA
jgi:lipid-binding SYLF domain-containing protein